MEWVLNNIVLNGDLILDQSSRHDMKYKVTSNLLLPPPSLGRFFDPEQPTILNHSFLNL
jgi:hypothetical protein